MHSEWDCFNIKSIALSVLFKISHKNHSCTDTGYGISKNSRHKTASLCDVQVPIAVTKERQNRREGVRECVYVHVCV